MVTNSPIRLTEDERLHQYVMHNIVKQIQSTSYILKGGTALILTRGLPRYSVDLDFDSERKLDIEHHIRKGLKSAGVEIISLSTSKIRTRFNDLKFIIAIQNLIIIKTYFSGLKLVFEVYLI